MTARVAASSKSKLAVQGDSSVLASGKAPDKDTYTLGFTNALAGVTGLLATWKTNELEVISLGGCKHTRHEAEKVAKLAQERGWKRVLLVTSASHLKRAAGVFRTTTPLEVTPVDPAKPVSLRASVDLGVCNKICMPAALQMPQHHDAHLGIDAAVQLLGQVMADPAVARLLPPPGHRWSQSLVGSASLGHHHRLRLSA